jgi:hypothetical protein
MVAYTSFVAAGLLALSVSAVPFVERSKTLKMVYSFEDVRV